MYSTIMSMALRLPMPIYTKYATEYTHTISQQQCVFRRAYWIRWPEQTQRWKSNREKKTICQMILLLMIWKSKFSWIVYHQSWKLLCMWFHGTMKSKQMGFLLRQRKRFEGIFGWFQTFTVCRRYIFLSGNASTIKKCDWWKVSRFSSHNM